MRPLESKRTQWALLTALMVVAYARVVSCGFIWDDDDYVTNNPVLETLGGLYDIWFVPTSLPQYYPLVHTSFWMEYRLWELHPLGYHLVNVLLHGASALALLRLGRRLALPGILFAALWFAVHPVHAESVAWVTERKNVLSLLCYLLAAERWLSWHDRAGARPARSYFIGSLWFLSALWSKTVTASLPAALLVLLWWRDGRLSRRAVTAALPWLVVGAGLGYFTVHLEAEHVGASGAPWQISGLERVLVAGRSCWFYAWSLVWPFGTCFNYPRWEVDAGVWWQWLFPAGAALAVLAAWTLRARVGRGCAAVLMIFGGTLFPAIGFFDVYPFRYSFVADHFQYHASVAVIVGVAALATQKAGALAVTARSGLAAAVLATMAAVTALDLTQYRDFETLWRVTVRKNPRSAIAHTNLGAIETEKFVAATSAGRAGEAARYLQAARGHLEAVLELDGASHEARNSLGVLAHRQGQREEARRLYEAALARKPDEPGPLSNLAMLELEEGHPEEALPHIEAALSSDPLHTNARIVRGWVLCELGRYAEARPELEWALQRSGQMDAVHRRYITCLLALGEHRLAAERALSYLRRNPGDQGVLVAMARGLAQLVRQQPVERARAFALAALRQGAIEPSAALPLVAAELRTLGDEARARAVEGS